MSIITKGLIGKEDLNIGTGSFTRSTSTGGTNTLTKINMSALAPAPQTVAFSATPAFDYNSSNAFFITLTGNVTSSTFVNGVAGQMFLLKIIQDGTGAHTFVYPTNVKGGMTVSPTANSINTQLFFFDGTNAYAIAPGTVN